MSSSMDLDQSIPPQVMENPFQEIVENFLKLYTWDGGAYYGAINEKYFIKFYRKPEKYYIQEIEDEFRIYETLSKYHDPQFSFINYKYKFNCEHGYIILLANDGENFKEYIQLSRTTGYEFSLADIYRFLISLAKTLSFMYTKGIACLCINPFNLLFCESKIYILDTYSSIVKFNDMTRDEDEIKLIKIYESPELKNSSNYPSIDPNKSDVFSLGIILYNLITLDMPNDLQEIIQKININSTNENLIVFKEMLLGMLDINPQARLSMEDLSINLDRLMLANGLQPLHLSIRLN